MKIVAVSRAVLSAALLFALAGCAGVPKKSYDRQAQAGIKTVTVLQPAIPADSRVWLAVDPGQSFGLVGALISAGVTSSRTSNYMAVVNAAQFDQRRYFLLSLVNQLKTAGYSPIFLDVPRDREKGQFLETYPEAKPAGDAILDTYALAVGYMAAGSGSTLPYRPTAYFGARLVSGKPGNEVLFSDEIAYNHGGPMRYEGITLQAATGHEYMTSDALVAAGNESIEGLKQALDAVAAEIVRQLR